MKTRNIASFLLIWLAAGIFFTAESAQSHEEASWQKVEYTPADRTIESIPIQAIDKTWYKVLVLTKKNQPPDILKDIQATDTKTRAGRVSGYCQAALSLPTLTAWSVVLILNWSGAMASTASKQATISSIGAVDQIATIAQVVAI